MSMKNRYIKNAHISEAKFKEILRLFGADLTATQISELAKLERKTVNRILQLLRARIAEFAEEESCFCSGEIEIDESYFGARRVRGKRGRGALGKTKVFGMKKRDDKVYTQVVANCSAAELVPIIKKLAPNDSTIYSDEWKAYDGLVNEGYKKHYRVKHSDDVFANGRAHMNGIENFWGVAKSRLIKLLGIRKEKFNLHLKET
ncbi:MAG: IS1595 family transposase [Holosporaceae bacterium]|nr:IS1595 family transposase [Holosporaceae bacterium]